MDEVIEITEDLVQQSRRVLDSHGRLSTALPGFISRIPQVELAAAIAKTIQNQSILIAEAGTGTGKTFAYLIPCLLSRKKILLSTATKTLQDQLFQKDLPMLVRALGLSLKAENLKGRANYICRYRVELYSQQGHFSAANLAEEIILIREKIPQLTIGERGELPEIADDSPIWPYATSTVENCIGAECPEYKNCYLVKARKRAMEADIVVINHHLYFADATLKATGFGELLPGVEVVVWDEAHQLAEIATQFYGMRFSTRQFIELINDILREWPVLDLANQPLKHLLRTAETLIDDMLSCVSLQEKMYWEQLIHQQLFQSNWNSLIQLTEEILQCFEEISFEMQPGLERCQSRLKAIYEVITQFLKRDKNHICWVERLKHTAIFHATPFEITESFQALLKPSCSYIFTSATLTMASSFAAFTQPLGLENSESMILPSPFDYQHQALLYMPRGLPDPKDSRYYDALFDRVLPIINACGGRCFFLFTSHRALQIMASMLCNKLDYPLLIQGEEAKSILLARFRHLGNAVLLGTATFWEGVDVKGEALSCVIIDKLPFTSPTDPVNRGKMAHLKAKGLSGFDTLSLPNAILALKQGVGRLIRDNTDTGVLMIADPRLTSRPYGKQIFASLPKMRKTRDEQTVLKFINQLALSHEFVSD